MNTALGPYRLAARLGAGAMGEVWQAVHGPTHRAVAVKLLRRNEPSFIDAVRVEIEAIAALDHPHIVALLDVGTVPDGSAAWIGGSPYLVMELLDGGSLFDLAPSLTWPETRDLLVALLSGLSHAHARQRIHRDLKPANVLRAGKTDPRPGWRISDFGLAHAHGDPSAAVREGVQGSPRYMAPEQFQGYRRDYGPWTDLYALGCLAWAVVTGRAPYQARDLPGLRHAHLRQSPPPLRPRYAVPDGLEDWLRALLHKRPHERTASAADALHGLENLGAPATPPTHPPTWRSNADVAPRAHLGTHSLALVDLRTPPFVGREPERTALWAELAAVHEHKTPRLAVVTGAPGQGETSLAEWVVHRARETGSARALWAHHHLLGGGGASEFIRDALHLHGLSVDDAHARLDHLKNQGAHNFNVDLILKAVYGQPIRPNLDEERAAVLATIEPLTRDRPLILAFDDLHRSAEARDLVRFLMAQPLPLFLVATGQPTGEADDVNGAADLRETAREFSAPYLHLGPLDTSAIRSLIRRMVDLDDAVAQRLETESRGHPLFVLKTLEGWVSDGALVPGARGWTRADDAPIALPQSLGEVVAQHLDRALSGRDSGERRAVEVAAVMGDPIDVQRWARTCLRAGASIGPDLVSHLLQEGVWRQDAGVTGPIRFAHSPLRALLLERAADAGRLGSHHRAAAGILAQDEAQTGRLGLHQLRCGDTNEAIQTLLPAAEHMLSTGDLGETARLLAWLDEALRTADPNPRAQAQSHVLHATVHVLRGAGGDAVDDLAKAEALATEPSWHDVRCRIASLRGRQSTRERRYDEALAQLDRAVQLAALAQNRELQGRTAYRRGNLLLFLGRLDEAERALKAARPHSRAHPGVLGKVLVALGRLAQARGDSPTARARYTEAKPWFSAASSTWGQAVVTHYVAELDRQEGHLDAAAEGYASAHKAYRSLGLRQADGALLHLGLVELARHNHAAARATFEHCLATFRAERAPLVGAVAWAGRLACDAAEANPTEAQMSLAALRHALQESGVVAAQLAETLDCAAAAAEVTLPPVQAAEVASLARSHWAQVEAATVIA
ncbi:MAG: protein kinase [Myxococcota bacterium]